MAKTSVKAAARAAVTADAKARAGVAKGTPALGSATLDSFTNFAQKMGIGADNALSTAGYSLNPITRNRTQLEWMHRGNWLCGLAVDIPADDMTRAGIDYLSELDPDQAARLDMSVIGLDLWPQINECIRWSRLYGGAVGVVLVDGQDPRTPLRPETVGPGQFKGLCILDRWMVEPTLEDLVTDYGPHLGLPRYYRVNAAAPALRGASVHYTRVAFRLVGVPLPYQQRLTEQLWGISVLERLFDRLVGFDSATTGVMQLVYKSYIRTMKVKGLREVVSAGGKPLEGFTAYMTNMRRYQGIEGITAIDGDDEMSMDTHQAFSGLDDVMIHLGQQLSGALQIPLVRLFGQSPAGLNSTGESDLRTYYDHIAQQQQKHLTRGVLLCYWLLAKSRGIRLPDDFFFKFRSLWELSDNDKATIAGQVATAVTTAHDSGLLTDKAAMQELRQSSRTTGIFSNITAEDLAQANDQLNAPPSAQDILASVGTGQPAGPKGAVNVPGNAAASPAVQQGPVGRAKLLPTAQPGGAAG